MKLVLRSIVYDCAYTEFTQFIPFEYSSKEDFISHLTNRYNINKQNVHKVEFGQIYLFDMYFGKKEIEELANNVFTIEEWFETFQENAGNLN